MRVMALRRVFPLLLLTPRYEAAPIEEESSGNVVTGRLLHGRFLHITDFHPDPFYKTYASTEQESACHRGTGPAGVYGAETSACDSPISLINETFRWIEDNLKDEIDFIIWTGDSARHDNDELIPRTERQVLRQNEFLVSKLLEVFGKPENYNDTDPLNDFVIPIVPTIGNNDIMPHNIFEPGPNWWTGRFLEIWRQFIPEEQRHQFERGGWFYVEVIKNQLAVFSLNTMYFYDSNNAVDGCADKSEPGYEHMEWLRIQLGFMRQRGMKAILIGHVPPARAGPKIIWDETCWQKYALWLRQYRDVIVGSVYGHMNIDHFMLQDFRDIELNLMDDASSRELAHHKSFDGDEITIESAGEYLIDLRNDWADLPKPHTLAAERPHEVHLSSGRMKSLYERLSDILHGKVKHKKDKGKSRKYYEDIGGEWAERYSVSHVSASVVPNYFPTLRVFEYNTTGAEGNEPPAPKLGLTGRRIGQIPLQALEDFVPHAPATDGYPSDSEILASHNKEKKPKFKVPDPPSESSPPGPAYSPQTFTFLGYTQYFANLTHINNDFTPGGSISDSTWTDDTVEVEKWKEGKHKGKHPKTGTKPHPKKFQFQVEYDTFSDKAYRLKDLTVKSYLDLAVRIGRYESDVDKDDIAVAEPVPEIGTVVASRLNETTIGRDASDHIREWGPGYATVTKKKNHKKHKNRRKKPHVWYTFVERAFVEPGT